ncbi:hypothetical protein AMAG_01782 [Allomyces macrogynus ATCC 38327]|uniref:DUF3730 domain-containing protein n=1 Tax=Allomyces macrogynus (strain ATCC 38327) TaxID=578462 RepID=A0A0L0S0I4_ALLM3|nr:hypothetical protein AMAG_01782 [Allomyces macrogynus ATCC 38327]|eukprot:KNE55925.1 hypothetical protein AMAG_01782 [Allomyces macrogynus ATCC 38327]
MAGPRTTSAATSAAALPPLDRALALRLAANVPNVVHHAALDVLRSRAHGLAHLLAFLKATSTSDLARHVVCLALRRHLLADRDAVAVRTTLVTLSAHLPHWPASSTAVATGTRALVELWVAAPLRAKIFKAEPLANPLVAVLNESPDLAGPIANYIEALVKSRQVVDHDLATRLVPVLGRMVLFPNVLLGPSCTPLPKRFAVSLLNLVDLSLDMLARAHNDPDTTSLIQSSLVKWSLAQCSLTTERDPQRIAWLTHLVTGSVERLSDSDGDWILTVTCLLLVDLAERRHQQLDCTDHLTALAGVLDSHPDLDVPLPLLFPVVAYALLDSVFDDTLLVPLLTHLTACLAHVSTAAEGHAAQTLVIPVLQLQADPLQNVREAASTWIATLDSLVIDELAPAPVDSSAAVALPPAFPRDLLTSVGVTAELLAWSPQLAPHAPHRILHVPGAFARDHAVTMAMITTSDLAAREVHAHHLLLFWLHHLRTASGSAAVAIVQRGFPALIEPKHVMVASKVLALQTHWAKSHATMPVLATSALIALHRSWLAWPRAFASFKDAVVYYLSSQKVLRAKGGRVDAELEVTVAGLVLDVVKSRPQELGDEAIVLIHRLADLPRLHPLSQRLVVQACRHGAQARLFDAAAVWNVVVAPMAREMLADPDQLFDAHAQLLYRDIVAFVPHIDAEALRVEACEEVIYPYLPFPAVVDHIDTDEETGDEWEVFKPKAENAPDRIAAMAVAALPALPLEEVAQMIPTAIPETAAIIIRGIQAEDQETAEAHAKLLAWLVHTEVDGLPRSLFFGRGMDVPAAASPEEQSKRVKAALFDVHEAKIKIAELCAKPPAVISNSALVSTLPVAPALDNHAAASFLGSFDHHMMIRLLAIPFYLAHFQRHLKSTTPVAALFGKYLEAFLVTAMSPNEKANALYALTALVHVLHALRRPDAVSYSDFLVSILAHRFVEGEEAQVADASKLGVSDDLLGKCLTRDRAEAESDEVRAAVAFCWGYLAPLAASDALMAKIAAQMMTTVEQPSDWNGFASAFSLCMLYCHRNTARTQTQSLEYLATIHDFLLRHATDQIAFLPIKKAVGLAMGIAYLLGQKPALVPEAILDVARDAVRMFPTDPTVPLRAACASWMLAYTNQTDDAALLLDLHAALQTVAVSDLYMLSHMMLAIAHARATDAAQCRSALNGHLAAMAQQGTSPILKMNHALAAFAAIGLDFVDPMASARGDDVVVATAPYLPVLLDVAGVAAKITNSRLAKVCLPLLAWTLHLWDTTDAAAAPLKRITVKEPANLNRFLLDSNYLRHVFDAFANCPKHALPMLLKGITVAHPLPLVDWYPVLQQVAGVDKDTAWTFAATNAASSYSCLDYLQDGVLRVDKGGAQWHRAVGEQGLGVLLDLAGVRKVAIEQRGRKGAIVAVSEDRILDVTRFLATLVAHIPDKPATGGVVHHLAQLMNDFYAQHAMLSIEQRGHVARAFVHSFAWYDMVVAGKNKKLLVHALVTVVHLLRAGRTVPAHLTADGVLVQCIHVALLETDRADVHAFLLDAVRAAIDGACVPADRAKSMAHADVAAANRQLRVTATAEWMVRVLDLCTLVATDPALGAGATAGVFSMQQMALVDMALRHYLLGLVGRVAVDEVAWRGEVALELQAMLARVPDQKTINGVLRRVAQLAAGHRKWAGVVNALLARMRYTEEGMARWDRQL